MRRSAAIVAIVSILLLAQLSSALVPGIKATTYTALDYVGNHCLNFTVANQRLDCGQHSIYQTENLTIEAWIRPRYNIQSGSDSEYGSNWGCVVCLRPQGGNGGWFLGFFYPTGKLYFIIDSGYTETTSDRQNWYNESWYHVAVTYDRTLPKDNLVFYVNGSVDASHNVTTTITYAVPELQIGSQAGTGLPYLGLLDEVRVWNVTRTQTEIQETWNTTLSDPTETATGYPNLVGSWHLDNSTMGNYLDYSIYRYDAVPVGMPELVEPGAPIVVITEFPSSMMIVVMIVTGTLGALLLRRRPRNICALSLH